MTGNPMRQQGVEIRHGDIEIAGVWIIHRVRDHKENPKEASRLATAWAIRPKPKNPIVVSLKAFMGLATATAAQSPALTEASRSGIFPQTCQDHCRRVVRHFGRAVIRTYAPPMSAACIALMSRLLYPTP